MDNLDEVMELQNADKAIVIGLIESFRIINETLNDPQKMDEAFIRVQKSIEKGATDSPSKASGNA